ncbi:MAG: amidohydrolase family protein, partial [Tagaea sp.]|nr:amidohydrolase family protein [Tagaea sp.]
AHHHLWDLRRFPYPWLRPGSAPRPFGDHTPIMRDYLPEDYRRDTRGAGVSASVHVEAAPGADDPSAESAWLGTLGAGAPAASVAHIDPASPSVAADLEAIRAHTGVRGVRAGIAWRADSPWRFAAGPEVSKSRPFRAGVAEIARRGLLMEFVLLPEQLPELHALARDHPDMPIVIDHLATLQPELPGQIEIWRAGMRRAAEAKNTYVKISGLWSIARDWNEARLRDPVRFAIDAFGADRCMWGSNLPIEGLMCPAARQIQILERIVEDRSGTTREAVFGGTARRLYRLGGAA